MICLRIYKELLSTSNYITMPTKKTKPKKTKKSVATNKNSNINKINININTGSGSKGKKRRANKNAVSGISTGGLSGPDNTVVPRNDNYYLTVELAKTNQLEKEREKKYDNLLNNFEVLSTSINKPANPNNDQNLLLLDRINDVETKANLAIDDAQRNRSLLESGHKKLEHYFSNQQPVLIQQPVEQPTVKLPEKKQAKANVNRNEYYKAYNLKRKQEKEALIETNKEAKPNIANTNMLDNDEEVEQPPLRESHPRKAKMKDVQKVDIPITPERKPPKERPPVKLASSGVLIDELHDYGSDDNININKDIFNHTPDLKAKIKPKSKPNLHSKSPLIDDKKFNNDDEEYEYLLKKR
jgi:hypothetical protein